MKNLNKYINKILKGELLKGNLPALENFAIEKFVVKRNSAEERQLKERLLTRIIEKKEIHDEIVTKLAKPEKLNTLGELLQLLITKDDVRLYIILSKTDIEQKEFNHILKNTIDITLVGVDKLVKLVKFFMIKLDTAIILLEKSIKLFQINPSVSNAMARYSYKDGLGKKDKSMKDGLNELLLKASNAKKLMHENIIQTSMPKNEFLELFKKEYLNVDT